MQRIEIESSKRRRENYYRAYMTKAAELITLNTANIAAGERQGFQMPVTYQDFIDPKKAAIAETKEQTPAEIKKKILGRIKRMRGDK